MVDSLKTLKRGNIICAGDNIFKIAKMGPVQVKRETLSSRSGVVQYEIASVRSCPPGFSGGELKVDDYGSYKIHRHIDGDYAQYAKMMDRWSIDLTCAAVGEGEWIPEYDIGDFTKLDLIAYVIAVHGPSLRDDIMRRVAALECLPWIPTSNTEYFSNVADSTSKYRYYGSSTDRPYLEEEGSEPFQVGSLPLILGSESTMCKAGKLGRKQLYDLGEAGKKRAKEVLAKMGNGPALAVK